MCQIQHCEGNKKPIWTFSDDDKKDIRHPLSVSESPNLLLRPLNTPPSTMYVVHSKRVDDDGEEIWNTKVGGEGKSCARQPHNRLELIRRFIEIVVAGDCDESSPLFAFNSGLRIIPPPIRSANGEIKTTATPTTCTSDTTSGNVQPNWHFEFNKRKKIAYSKSFDWSGHSPLQLAPKIQAHLSRSGCP